MGARSALRLRLTDEQPALCVEPRGPGSLSRKKKEVEDQSVGSFTGGFSRRRVRVRSRRRRKGRRREKRQLRFCSSEVVAAVEA